MPLDPQTVQAAADAVQVLAPGTLGGVVANGLPSAGVLGTVAWLAYKRVQKAEATVEAISESCLQLLKLHEKDEQSNGEVIQILEKLVARDKSQHLANRWTQDALKLIVRRLGQTTQRGDVDADALELDLPPHLET